ncbi:MAG: type 1 glutamine amidotransferase [Candidatus Omnitrophica bacterium]|nr:type 1 glutamine amidotransferase [Candidatus Omnitrophota bacterium]
MSKKILIVKHVLTEGPGSIGVFFKDTAWNLQTVELSEGDRLPSNFEGVDAVIFMGGPMNVYEEEKYPFLKDEDMFIKQALTDEIPILGICLGSQLLAKAAGARVKKSPVKEIGWYPVSLTNEGLDDALFDGLAPNLEIFQWHEDTFDIPEGGDLLAEGSNCRNQAFRFGKNAYGLQFHIETTPDMVKEWLDSSAIEESERNRMLLQTHKKNGRFSKRARIIISNFSKIIKRSDFF